jgi:hypothetical protein
MNFYDLFLRFIYFMARISAGYTYEGVFVYYNRKNVNINEITPNENGELVLANLESFPQNISKIDVYKIDSDISIVKGAVSQTISNGDTTISNGYTTISNGYAIRIDKNLYTVKEEDLAKLSNPNQIIVKANDGSFVTINTNQSQNFSLSNDTSVLPKSIKPQTDLIAFVNKRPMSADEIAILIAVAIILLLVFTHYCYNELVIHKNQTQLNDIISSLENTSSTLTPENKKPIDKIITSIRNASSDLNLRRYYFNYNNNESALSLEQALDKLNTVCGQKGIKRENLDTNLQKALQKGSSLELKIKGLKILTDAFCQHYQSQIPSSPKINLGALVNSPSIENNISVDPNEIQLKLDDNSPNKISKNRKLSDKISQSKIPRNYSSSAL